MTVTEIRDNCLSKTSTTYDFPFDEQTCVVRVAGKIFAFFGINSSPARVTLKCDPGLARDLRASFDGVVPGYHTNKEHWNTVTCEDSDVPAEKVQWMIDHSYDLIVESLPKSKRPSP